MPKCSPSASKRPPITASPIRDIVTGDVALFAALIEALDLAPAWKRRLLKDFNRKATLADDLARLTLANRESAANIRACSPRSPMPIRRPPMRSSPTCCRSPASARSAGAASREIADRFVEQAELGASNALPAQTRALIERFLAIAGAPDEAAAALRALCGRGRHFARPRARSVRTPHRLSRRARRRSAPHPICHRIRPRRRLLHRLRIRTARPGAPGRRATGGGRPLRRPADPARQRAAGAGGRARGVDRTARGAQGKPGGTSGP